MVVCQLSHDVIGYEDSLSVIGVFNFDPFIVTVKDVQSPINNILSQIVSSPVVLSWLV